MKKKYKVSLISVMVAAVAAILIAVCVLFARPAAVYAADRYVTMDGTNVFYTSIRGAEVTSGKETKTEEQESGPVEKDSYYTLFKIGADENISYRKSLAYSWYSGEFGEDKNPTGAYEQHFFSMTIGFDAVTFEKFIIEFQSQQYLKSDDKITKNFLVFTPSETEGCVDIGATDDIEKEDITYPVTCSVADNARIEIAFGNYDNGKIAIKINGEERELYFENVYYPYASYISSGDTAVTPLNFTAKFADGATAAEGELTADMKLYELNGQSFELYAHDSDGVYNDVLDNAPPVMCFTRTPSYLEFGKSISFNYQVIDVLASSPRATANFYVLSGEQFDSEDFKYMQTEYDAAASGEGEGDEGEKPTNPFITVTSGSDIRVIRDDKTYVPSRYLEGGDDYSEDYTVYGLAKIYFEVSDVTGSSAKTDKVFADWYAESGAIVNIYDIKNNTEVVGNEKNTGNFIKIIDGKDGATYAGKTDADIESYKTTVRRLQNKYQTRIDEAIENLEGGKLYAGGDSNFYLPAYDLLADENLVDDEYCNILDYKYSIYYKGKTTGTNLSLDYNKLSIPLSDADTTYRFTIFVTDAFNNPMRYPDKDEDDNLVWKEITTEDIWDEDFYDLLPFFEFDVSYKKATAENPDSLSVAYVGTSYNGISFDIKDSSNTSTATYKLYVFDRNGAYRDLGLSLTYAEFEENFEKLFGDTYKEGVSTRKYFRTVKPSGDLKQTDSDYDWHKAINWNSSAVSFTPQSAEDFYVVRLTLTDNRSQDEQTYFATVAASIQANPLKGETEWVQNNITAIVLLSVAGVLLIAFILLLVIKPKDKGDIDEIYAKNKKKDKKSK